VGQPRERAPLLLQTIRSAREERTSKTVRPYRLVVSFRPSRASTVWADIGVVGPRSIVDAQVADSRPDQTQEGRVMSGDTSPWFQLKRLSIVTHALLQLGAPAERK